MERWVVKVLAALILFIVIFLCTTLPIPLSGWFRKKGVRGQRVMAICRCFGGGAFLGAFLLHAMPEADVVIHDALLEPHDIAYHIPELLAGCGFFILMFLEKFILSCILSGGEGGEEQQSDTGTYMQTYNQHVDDGDAVRVEKTICDNKVADEETKQTSVEKDKQKANHQHDHHQHQQKQHDPSHILPESQKGTFGFAKSCMLLFALSIDCLFEGLSLGLQETNAGAWNMTIAILSHEFIIGFTLGLELLKNNPVRRVFGLSLFYALTPAIGITIGALISELGNDVAILDIVSGFLQALTAGVFIYVTFFEILVDEITHDTPLGNIMAVFLGFALMAVLAGIPEGAKIEDGAPAEVVTTLSPTAIF